MKITAKQNKFAENISEGMTYYDAYHDAYPASLKWKDNVVYVQSSMLMKNDKVLIRISELLEESKGLREESMAEVLNEISSWIQFDPIDMFNKDSSLKDIHDMPERVRKSIVSFEVIELHENIDREKVKVGELKKVKLVDKKGAAEMQLKKLGAFITNINVTNDNLEHLEDLLKDIED